LGDPSVTKKEVLVGSEKTPNKEFITITDIETGEILDQFWRERRKKPSGRPPDGGKQPNFYRVYCTNWADVIDRKRLTFSEIGVLMSLMRFVDWESNFLIHPITRQNLSCQEIAKLLNTERNRLNEHMEVLHKKGLLAIVKCGGNGFPNHYILNTNILFKGNRIKDVNEHKRFIKDCAYEPPVKVKYKEREGR